MPNLCRLLPVFLAAAVPSQDLEEARRLLEERNEAEVRRGAEICVRADNVDAVELLLEVLEQTERRSRAHLAPGHYRDIVWDALAAIKDHYARRRVEQELAKGRDPFVRQWCAELLGIYGDRGFGETLERALAAKDDPIVWSAARSLGMLKFDGADKKLFALTRDKHPRTRANAIEALARIDPGQFLTQFLVAVREDKDGGVRCALLGAAPEVAPDRVEEFCTSSLLDEDWRPRLQAVENLGAIRTKTSVDSLLKALQDGRPIVAARANAELQRLTGQPIEQPEVWAKWWADNRATFAFPDKPGAVSRSSTGTVAYNGVPVDSDHVAFLIDKSYRMKEDLTSKGMSKEAAAAAELERVLEILDGKLVFNVFNYDTELEAFQKKPVKLSAKVRKRAVDFASAPSDGREKDIWNALETVVSDPTLDTLYLLSSGEPDTGLYVHWNRVTRHLADLNRFHKVTVHSVAYTDNEWYRDQLKKIAEVTGGHFEWLK